MQFSQRKGLKPASKALQLEAMDAELRNALWNCYSELVLPKFNRNSYPYDEIAGSNMESYFKNMWDSLFRAPVDSMPDDIEKVAKEVRKFFYGCQWNEVYDFLEFNLASLTATIREPLRACWNASLERDNAAYRIVNDQVTEITNEQELREIDDAIGSPIGAARQHLEAALRLMSDRKSPDYRNSIKESISAVESVCRALTGDHRATLGDALDLLAAKVPLHGALKRAFSAIYGYTSDEGGIRHAMLEEPNLTFADAKFMLLACSSFVNYIVSKASEVGLRLNAAV